MQKHRINIEFDYFIEFSNIYYNSCFSHEFFIDMHRCSYHEHEKSIKSWLFEKFKLSLNLQIIEFFVDDLFILRAELENFHEARDFFKKCFDFHSIFLRYVYHFWYWPSDISVSVNDRFEFFENCIISSYDYFIVRFSFLGFLFIFFIIFRKNFFLLNIIARCLFFDEIK